MRFSHNKPEQEEPEPVIEAPLVEAAKPGVALPAPALTAEQHIAEALRIKRAKRDYLSAELEKATAYRTQLDELEREIEKIEAVTTVELPNEPIPLQVTQSPIPPQPLDPPRVRSAGGK